jgi:cobalt-zinc-cadmium efflux system outer membrane protein
MNPDSFKTLRRHWRLAAWLTVLGGAARLVDGAEKSPAGTNAPPVALDALVADVLEHNPELNFYRAEIAAAKGERRTAGQLANPEVSATLGNKRVSGIGDGVAYVWQERTGDRETQIGLGVTVPLPLWNRNKGSVETAEPRQQQAATSLLVTQRQIERQVAEKAMRYQAKLTEMGKWRPDSIEKFQEAAALADRHYRLGAVPIATYVELQKQYLEAVEALLDTKTEALEAGQQLELLTGVSLSIANASAK